MRFGFETELKFWTTGMEPRWFGVRGKNTLEDILSSDIRNIHRRAWKDVRGKLHKYINAGGELRLEPVMPSDIKNELGDKRSMIVSINNRVMLAEGRANRGHYIVPVYVSSRDTQCSKPMISYLDPLDGKEHTKYLEDIMFFNHIWEGAGLFIRPTKRVHS